MLAHVLPYVLYVAPGAVAGALPAAARPWAGPAGALLAAAALVVFARRGAYPELRRGPAAAPRARLLAVGAGAAVALLWMPLADAVPGLGARGGFDPSAAGERAAPLLWTARVAGFVAVIPFAEELLVRSLLPRFVDAADAWRERPVGAFTAASAVVSVGFFAATHPEWLAALAAGVLWTALLAATRRLGDAVLSHAVANAALAAVWAATGDLGRW